MIEDHELERVRSIIGEALGEASMCWNPNPSGEFDSTAAVAILERTLSALKQVNKQRPRIHSKKMLMAIHDAVIEHSGNGELADCVINLLSATPPNK